MRLPKEFVEENLKKAKGSMVFGIPIEDLSRDELIACVVAGFLYTNRQIKETIGHKKAKNIEEVWSKKLQEDYKEKPHGWVQWKETDVCMDLHCVCGELSHIDGDFAYNVKCGNCGTVFFCNGHIELIELKEEPEDCVIVSE